MTFHPRILPFGESALLVELADDIDERAIVRARVIADAWERLGVGAAVPAYGSVVLSFGGRLTPKEAELCAREILNSAGDAGSVDAAIVGDSASRIVEIPTHYDGEDLAEVAAMSTLSVDELIALHSGREYTAFFLGFLPGWAYCGQVDPRIKAPRLPSPRPRIAPGTVAVIDGQTGVYSFPSPGGWRLIGSTDAVMFDPAREQPSLLRAGDRVRFVPR